MYCIAAYYCVFAVSLKHHLCFAFAFAFADSEFFEKRKNSNMPCDFEQLASSAWDGECIPRDIATRTLRKNTLAFFAQHKSRSDSLETHAELWLQALGIASADAILPLEWASQADVELVTANAAQVEFCAPPVLRVSSSPSSSTFSSAALAAALAFSKAQMRYADHVRAIKRSAENERVCNFIALNPVAFSALQRALLDDTRRWRFENIDRVDIVEQARRIAANVVFWAYDLDSGRLATSLVSAFCVQAGDLVQQHALLSFPPHCVSIRIPWQSKSSSNGASAWAVLFAYAAHLQTRIDADSLGLVQIGNTQRLADTKAHAAEVAAKAAAKAAAVNDRAIRMAQAKSERTALQQQQEQQAALRRQERDKRKHEQAQASAPAPAPTAIASPASPVSASPAPSPSKGFLSPQLWYGMLFTRTARGLATSYAALMRAHLRMLPFVPRDAETAPPPYHAFKHNELGFCNNDDEDEDKDGDSLQIGRRIPETLAEHWHVYLDAISLLHAFIPRVAKLLSKGSIARARGFMMHVRVRLLSDTHIRRAVANLRNALMRARAVTMHPKLAAQLNVSFDIIEGVVARIQKLFSTAAQFLSQFVTSAVKELEAEYEAVSCFSSGSISSCAKNENEPIDAWLLEDVMQFVCAHAANADSRIPISFVSKRGAALVEFDSVINASCISLEAARMLGSEVDGDSYANANAMGSEYQRATCYLDKLGLSLPSAALTPLQVVRALMHLSCSGSISDAATRAEANEKAKPTKSAVHRVSVFDQVRGLDSRLNTWMMESGKDPQFIAALHALAQWEPDVIVNTSESSGSSMSGLLFKTIVNAALEQSARGVRPADDDMSPIANVVRKFTHHREDVAKNGICIVVGNQLLVCDARRGAEYMRQLEELERKAKAC
jgi:hypothetical protein